MKLDDIRRLQCRPEGPPDAIWLSEADMNALLADTWESCWPKPPSPPIYERGKSYAVWGIPVDVMEVFL